MSENSKGSGMYGQRRRNQFGSPTGIGSIGGSDAGCGDRAAQNKSPDFAEQAKSAANKVSDTLSKTVGIEKLEGFSLKALFADVFKKHPEEEVERIFMYGTPETTPDIRDVDTSWPRPWIFTRALIASVAIYWVLHTGFDRTGNIFLLPSMMFVGSFAVPMSALIFFIESNVRRNVSLYQVFRAGLVCGVIGIVWASFTWKIFSSENNYVIAFLAGLIEEPVKLAALWKCRYLLKLRYIHNGLLVGAGLGAGFAAFESMGYAFVYVLVGDRISDMETVILLRGVFAPFGHIIWTAIVCAALWRVKGSASFKLDMLVDKRFLRLAALPVVLHILWDFPSIPIIDAIPFLKYFVLGIVGWVAVLSLIQEGLKEIRKEKSLYLGQWNK